MNDCNDVISALRQLEVDHDVPPSLRTKINSTVKSLEVPGTDKLKLNKALHELEVIGEDCNIQPMTRAALMGVLMLIESKTRAS